MDSCGKMMYIVSFSGIVKLLDMLPRCARWQKPYLNEVNCDKKYNSKVNYP